MHPQLQDILDDYESARDRLQQLVSGAPASLWNERPQPGRWSVAECVVHLNLTSSACIPLVTAGLAEARLVASKPHGRYRRDVSGWLLWKTMGPPVRFRTRTSAAFVPGNLDDRERILETFEQLQEEQIGLVRQADGLALDRVRVTSQFDARVKYNLFSLLSILPRHQHRHLWQAEQALQTLQTR